MYRDKLSAPTRQPAPTSANSMLRSGAASALGVARFHFFLLGGLAQLSAHSIGSVKPQGFEHSDIPTLARLARFARRQ